MWILKISCLISLIGCLFVTRISYVEAKTHQILVDSDIDTDDLFAILYLLKQDRTKFKLKAITISANAWTDAGHAVNQLYDMLYMMDRDDVQVGVGGEGGILPDGTILPNVGGYLPLIEQGISTIGGCRYRQAIPVGLGGRLDIDTNFGFRRGFLPQGERHYSPLFQPTAQQVMIDTISSGRVTVFLIGTHTNFAIFLMTNPHLRKNIEHIYIMGGGIRSKNPTGCCPQGASTTCKPRQCGDHGNLFTGYTSNPYAEFNMFGDPFAAYQVFHSGLPITLVPLDATNTIPVNEDFFKIFKQRQDTYESQYVFKSLKITRDTWFDNQFYTSYFMWDSFTSGIAVSIMNNASNQSGENEFSEMEYMNITVITSNQPYNTQDGSNPFFNDRTIPKFNLSRDGVHSGHVQSGLRDPFCFKESGKGICQDGYTKEVTGPDSVRVLVATKAKPNQDKNSQLNREFFKSFLDVLNRPKQSGKFNITTQFLHYRETLYKPDFSQQKLGKDVIFDMDMSVGDFLSLIYLLKVPVNEINLKGILVNGNGWANAGTIDVVYDILHMMGRDDIPVGLGSVFALGEANPSFSAVGDCKYTRAIPYGRGGFLDSDTLFGFSRTLPRSPRRYTAENSVKFGAPRNTDNPELRQPLAIDVWRSISGELSPSSKFTVLTSGPLTNLANIILSDKNASSIIQDVYIVGGYIRENDNDTGNLFSIPSNKYAEFNFFLDPLASKAIMESDLHITLIPLNVQRRVSSFPMILKSIMLTKKTPEAVLSHNLLSSIYYLQQKHHAYKHMEMFLGEILGAVIMSEHQHLNTKVQTKKVIVTATGDISKDGQIIFDKDKGKSIKIVKGIDTRGYYHHYASALGNSLQSAKISSFKDQKKMWSTPGKN